DSRQRRQRAHRAEDEIADAGDVDHRPVAAGRIEHAGQLGDHGRAPATRGSAAPCQRRAVPACWAWQMATASASAASAVVSAAPGSNSFTIIWICSLVAWPAPTTDFFTRLAGYSATGSPAKAGHSNTTPRA